MARKDLAEWTPLIEGESLNRDEQELKNMLTVSKLITEAAFERKGSVGAHYRSDYPGKGDDWQRRINIRLKDGEPRISDSL